MSAPGITARRRRHVHALCEEHEVRCEFQPKGVPHGSANPEQRRVLIPPTTMVRSYYIALHEIGHCVLGYQRDQPAAPQEAATWQWAIEQAIEPPTTGVKRMMFRTLWHYLLNDLARSPGEDMSNAEMFPSPDSRFWSFLGSLDDASRLLYEATMINARVGPAAEERLKVRQVVQQERERRRDGVRRARIKEQLRIYGPPRPARAGQLVLLGASQKAHVWRRDGMYGAFVNDDLFCGSQGVAHAASPGAPPCKKCESLSRYPDDAGR